MSVKVNDLRILAEKHNLDLCVLVTWDRATNTTRVTTYGSDHRLADAAHTKGCEFAKFVGLAANGEDWKLDEDERWKHPLPGEEE